MQKIDFKDFSTLVEKQYNMMTSNPEYTLVRVRMDSDTLWNIYLDAFPDGTNEVFRERREHDCNHCKNFIRRVGNVVALHGNKVISVWDVEAPGYFNDVAKLLSELVKCAPIENYYMTSEKLAGFLSNVDGIDPSIKWNHFFVEVPKQFIVPTSDIGTKLGELNTHFQVLKRSLKEFKLDAAETIMELIDQNSLYRGAEHSETINRFIKTKKEYDATPDHEKENYLWQAANKLKGAGRFRSSVIGTLIEDLSEGVDVDKAVASFESKVAPSNYKRTSAVVTPKMIASAQEKLVSIGYANSIARRMANIEDIDVNQVMFTTQKDVAINVFDSMIDDASAKAKPKDFSKIETISLEKFVNDVVPKAQKLEVLFERRMKSNLMTMVAPEYVTAPNMLKWDNPLSWAYNGDVTDSIKERVKSVGGDVSGELRVSLAWHNPDDLDLKMLLPDKTQIYHGNRTCGGGELDIDMNAYGKSDPEFPVENIFFRSLSSMKKGKYAVYVNNYNKRSNERIGFELSVDIKGEIKTYSYDKVAGKNMYVLTLEFDGKDVKIVDVSPQMNCNDSFTEKTWNIDTNTFVPVKFLMNSPNHWSENKVGNKHLFFILDGCKNDEPVRGFFNEYLKPELNEHRKVLEVLGSKTKAVPTENQLSGLGFSETVRNEITVRVTGKINRVLKVQI